MLFLLRQIRRNLLTKKKVAIYLLYAVGEIFLVVIGILIAVQIDEWNKKRETEAKTKTYLVNLKSEVEVNKEILYKTIKANQDVISACRRLCNIIGFDSIQASNELSTLIPRAFAPNVLFQPNVIVLEEMTASGNIKTIKNSDLKKAISNLSPLLNNIRFQEDVVWEDKELCINQLRTEGSMRKVFDDSGQSTTFLKILEGGKSDGNDILLSSVLFENNLLVFTASSIGLEYQYQSTLKAIENLSDLIQDEVKN